MMVWILMGAAAAADARFVSAHHQTGIVLSPQDGEWVRIHKGAVWQPAGPDGVQAMEVRLHTIDGVSVGSEWWVSDQGQRCVVDGFTLVEMEASAGRPASPCGAPLVLASLDCGTPIREGRQPQLAVPLGDKTPTVGAVKATGQPVADGSTLQAALLADPARAAVVEDNAARMLYPAEVTSWEVGASTVQSVLEGSLSFTVSTVVVDGTVRGVHEGSTTAVFDLDHDASPELLGWGGQVPGVGEDLYSWQLRSADGAVLQSTVIDWCEGG